MQQLYELSRSIVTQQQLQMQQHQQAQAQQLAPPGASQDTWAAYSALLLPAAAFGLGALSFLALSRR